MCANATVSGCMSTPPMAERLPWYRKCVGFPRGVRVLIASLSIHISGYSRPSVVCLRAHPKGLDEEERLEALNKGLMHCLNAGGRFFLSHTRLNGMYTIRIAIGNLGSTEQLIQGLWTELQATLEALKDMLTS